MPSSTYLVSLASSSTLLYLSALKSTRLTLLSQSSPSVSRTLLLTPLLVSLLRVSCFSPKPYFIIHNLYIRFAPLSSLTKSTISSAVLLPVSLPRVLPPMTLKDLFNRFAPKASAIFLNPPAAAKSPPAPQLKTLPVPPTRHEKEPSAKPYINPVEQQGSNVSKFDPNGVFQSLWEKYGLNKKTRRSKPFFELSSASTEAHTNQAGNSWSLARLATSPLSHSVSPQLRNVATATPLLSQ